MRSPISGGGRRWPPSARGSRGGAPPIAATAGALAVGRLAPELLNVARWPYVMLGTGYAGLAIGLLLIGAHRQRELQRALERDATAPLSFRLVALFTAGASYWRSRRWCW